MCRFFQPTGLFVDSERQSFLPLIDTDQGHAICGAEIEVSLSLPIKA